MENLMSKEQLTENSSYEVFMNKKRKMLDNWIYWSYLREIASPEKPQLRFLFSRYICLQGITEKSSFTKSISLNLWVLNLFTFLITFAAIFALFTSEEYGVRNREKGLLTLDLITKQMLSSSRDTCLSCHVCVTMAQITSTLYLPKWRHSSKSSLIKTTQDKVNFYLFKKMRFSCYKYNPVLRFYPDRKCSVTIIWRHKESNFRRSYFWFLLNRRRQKDRSIVSRDISKDFSRFFFQTVWKRWVKMTL